MRWSVLILALLLAGCTTSPAPASSTDAGWSDAWESGEAFLFPHSGGELTFSGRGVWELELYDADDHRVGRFIVDKTPLGINGLRAGELVVRVIQQGETLDLRSDGAAVPWLRALPVHVERHVLADRLDRPGTLGLLQDPLDETHLELELAHPATHVFLRATGSFERLHVVARDAEGPILEVLSNRSQPYLPFFNGFRDIPGENFPDNAYDGHLNVTLRADHFDGLLLLEAVTYSRANPPQFAVAGPAPSAPGDVAHFEYGTLLDRPVRFQVHPDARVLELHAAESSLVTVWGPDDGRLAAVPIDAGTAVHIPVTQGGDYVAMAYGGDVALRADRTPADFELHVLERSIWHSPTLQGNGYIVHEEEADIDGVAYLVTRGSRPSLSEFCTRGAFTTISQEGETIGHWWLDIDSPNRWLQPGPIHYRAEGWADEGCLEPLVEIHSWIRPF